MEVLYYIVIRAIQYPNQVSIHALSHITTLVMSWAHISSSAISRFLSDEYLKIVEFQVPFQIIINSHFHVHNTFPPIKVFRHVTHSFDLYQKRVLKVLRNTFLYCKTQHHIYLGNKSCIHKSSKLSVLTLS